MEYTYYMLYNTDLYLIRFVVVGQLHAHKQQVNQADNTVTHIYIDSSNLDGVRSK